MKNPNGDNSIIGSNSPTMITAEMGGDERRSGVEMGQKRNRSGRSKAKPAGESSEHDIHIWTERERRKKMRNMFAGLHSLLPQLPAKVDKSTIVDEAVSYIKTLQQTLQTLQKQKMERAGIENDREELMISPQAQSSAVTRESYMADHQVYSNTSSPTSMVPPASFQTWFSPNLVLSMAGDDAHICVCTPRKPAIFTTILYILEKHKLELVSAHISSDHCRSMYMFHVHASEASHDQFPGAFSVEEVFKLAVGEINLWLLSC